MLGPYIDKPTAYSDDWEDQPTQGPFFQWGLGAVLPLVVLVWGLAAIIVRHSYWSDERGIGMTLHGANAIATGAAALSIAVFLHCHYFWGNVYEQAWFAVLGKIAGAVGFIVGIAIVIVRVGILGRN